MLQKVKAFLVGMDLQMSVIFSQLGASQPWEKEKENNNQRGTPRIA
jgi:hypothetical protein